MSLAAKTRTGRWLLVILALALGVRLAYVYAQVNHGLFAVATFAPDSKRYMRLAKHLAESGVFAYNGVDSTAADVPGYPLFLALVKALCGPELIWIYLSQALLSTATVWLVFILGRRYFSERAGLASAALAALYPMSFAFVAIPLGETLYVFLATAFLALYAHMRDSWRLALAAGLVAGAAVLTRPVLAGFAGLAGLAALALPGKRGKALVMLLGLGLALAPWVIRNAVTFHEFIPLSTRGGFEFYLGNAPDSTGGSGGHLSWGHDVKPPPGPPPGVSDNAWSAQLTRKALQGLAERPELFWSRLPAKIWNMWRPTWEGASPRNWLLVGGFYILIVLLALVSLLRRGGRAGLLWGYWGYHVLAHALIYGIIRYRLPVEPAICVLAGQGLLALLGAAPRRGEDQAGIA